MFARRALAALGLTLVAAVGGNQLVVHLVRGEVNSGAILYSEPDRGATRRVLDAAAQPTASEVLPVPFVEVDPFGPTAWDWSQMSSQFAAGMAVFDANGDGRLDVYFCQDGQNWTRPTTPGGVLLDAPHAQHNGLFLNTGNDPEGRPTFQEAAAWAAQDGTNVEMELLVEGLLDPRADPAAAAGPGRHATVALPVDLNADGLVDLFVGNAEPGMIWSSPQTWGVLGQFVGPIGRSSRASNNALPAMGLAMIAYTPRGDLGTLQSSARGEEPVGADSLYLNRGDADGDGLPEWQDVTREVGIVGRRTTASVSAADIDLDGDLDLFVGNAMDPDFFPAGATGWAGGANEVWVNLLAEEGELRFVESASALNLDGVFDDDAPMPTYWRLRHLPWLPDEYSFLFLEEEPYRPPPLTLGGQTAEQAEITWASAFQDVDQDGFPDLWVANDFGTLRLYHNEGGRRFTLQDHAGGRTTGNWMALAGGDFDGDQREDMLAGNLGGSIFTNGATGADPYALFDPVIQGATLAAMFVNGAHDTRHVLIDGADPSRALPTRVRHSAVLPPDAALAGNFRDVRVPPNGAPFDPDSLDPYEFAWGMAAADVQNDGRLDVYLVGTLTGRGGGVNAISGTNPGRLLINESEEPGSVRFADATAEHHLFNILELRYDHLDDGYLYRRSPTKNWSKRDLVYSYDRSAWTAQGPLFQQSISNSDLIQTAESGKGAVWADLNGDGFSDLIVRNGGGYDSRASDAANLKIVVDGIELVLPPHSYNFPVPTEYEPGSTRLFVNRYRDAGSVEVELVDLDGFNRDAIGATLVLDGRIRAVRAGDGSFLSNQRAPVSFGLGDGRARELEVRWPDAARATTHLDLTALAPDGLANGVLTITRLQGRISSEWSPR